MLKTPDGREIRDVRSILFRVVIATVIGAVLAPLILSFVGVSVLTVVICGVGFGFNIGVIHGLFIWTLFPYRMKKPDDSIQPSEHPTPRSATKQTPPR